MNSDESKFQWVYVNQDGSVRELSPDERNYLSEEFSGADGGRPYIKPTYGSRDGWGSRSGFMERSLVPKDRSIEPINSNYDQLEKDSRPDVLDENRAAGDLITVNEDGSMVCSPDPKLSHEQRFALHRKFQLAEQRRREALARIK